MTLARMILIGVMGLALAACSNKNGLKQVRHNGNGPDEFLVLPSKPLTQPDNYSALPAPTPGGANRVDVNPKAEAVAALGGNPNGSAVIDDGNIPSSDSALVNHARRNGVPADTRQSLAAEDEKFRDRQAVATSFKIFKVDRYSQAYRNQALDPFEETQRLRSKGASTPSSPPPVAE